MVLRGVCSFASVEVTLRERANGDFEYVQWVEPRSWASWFGHAKATRSLVFHFVKIVHWRGGRKIATFELDDKQL